MTAPVVLPREEIERLRRLHDRAFDELERVCGMGKYAQDVRGGPPQPPRRCIPAREDDTDLLIGRALHELLTAASSAAALREENERLRAACDAFEQASAQALKDAAAAEEKLAALAKAAREFRRSPHRLTHQVELDALLYPESSPAAATQPEKCGYCGGRGTVPNGRDEMPVSEDCPKCHPSGGAEPRP